MGATRALVMRRSPSGAPAYINNLDLAKDFLCRLVAFTTECVNDGKADSTSIEVPIAVAARSETLGLALEAHRALDSISGRRHHSLGTALRDAISKLAP